MNCPPNARYQFGELLLEPGTGRLFRGAEEIGLAPLSRKLLLALVEHSPSALSHEDLQQKVWDGRYVTAATVKQRIKLLRRAIADDAQAPRYVALDRGIGYRLIPPVTAVKPTLGQQQVGRRRNVPILAARLATLALLLALLLPTLLGIPEAGKIEPAASVEASVTRPTNTEAEAHYKKARLFYHRRGPGDIERARDLLLKAIATEPGYAKAWVALAGVFKLQYWETGELDRERSLEMQKLALEKALTLDPNLAEAHARIGQLYARTGESQVLAREAMETALKLAPHDPMVLAIHAWYLLKQDMSEQSLAYMQRAVDLEPYSLIHRHNLAIMYLKFHRLGDAERELEQTATIHPSMKDVLALDFAHLLILQGRPKEALKWLPKLEEADRLALRVMALNDLGDTFGSKSALAALTSLPGAYARLRQGEAEAYIHNVDTAEHTLAAIQAVGAMGPEAFKLAQLAKEEFSISPFLTPGEESGKDGGKGIAVLD